VLDIIRTYEDILMNSNTELHMSKDPKDNGHRVIELEDYGKRGEQPPKGCAYRIRIDREAYIVHAETITGRELLELAQKAPIERYMVFQKARGQMQEIGLDDTVDLTHPGIERFVTLPKDTTEGYSNRRHFTLPGEDQQSLDALGLPWETVIEGTVRRVIIYNYPLPNGYNQATINLCLRIEPQYPDTQIDMVYFHPHLVLTCGRSIPALSTEQFDGRVWQRWSRHRTRQNPWRPGIDNIATHLGLVKDWLGRELGRS
jgi:hypothetical protein